MPTTLVISRQAAPSAHCTLVLAHMARQSRRGLHLRWGVQVPARQELHLPWDRVIAVARQELHLRYAGLVYAPTRQRLRLFWGRAGVLRQCVRMWWQATYCPRQCLHLRWDMLPMPRQGLHLPWDMLPTARQGLRLIWATTATARQGLRLIWDTRPAARQCLHLRWGATPTTRRCLHLIWSAEHAAPPETTVTIAGVPVHPISIRVTEDADQAVITAVLEFAEALPAGLGPPAPVTIYIMGIRYDLLGESYSRSREFGSRSWTLTAASPAYRLQSRYADDVDGELIGMASAIARRLAGSIPLDWRMVDWDVQPLRLSPTGQAPLDVLRDLVSAAGGIVTSSRDGRLIAMPWPPLRPAHWPAYVEAETDSLSAMISITDDADERDLRNAVTVMDESESKGGLRIEEVPDTRIGGRAEVWVYQIPWQDSFDTRHCGDSVVVLRDLGIEERTIEEEMLEIVDGRGKTRWPIYGIVSARWNAINLGGITHAEDGTITAAVPGESLLYLTYRTKARRYLVDMRTDNPEPIMIVAED